MQIHKCGSLQHENLKLMFSWTSNMLRAESYANRDVNYKEKYSQPQYLMKIQMENKNNWCNFATKSILFEKKCLNNSSGHKKEKSKLCQIEQISSCQL